MAHSCKVSIVYFGPALVVAAVWLTSAAERTWLLPWGLLFGRGASALSPLQTQSHCFASLLFCTSGPVSVRSDSVNAWWRNSKLGSLLLPGISCQMHKWFPAYGVLWWKRADINWTDLHARPTPPPSFPFVLWKQGLPYVPDIQTVCRVTKKSTLFFPLMWEERSLPILS